MTIAEWISLPLLLLGSFFFLAGTVGLLRFPDVLTRLHALTKADNLGLGLIVLGLIPVTAGLAEVLQLLVVWLLVMLSGASASHLVARAALAERKEEPGP